MSSRVRAHIRSNVIGYLALFAALTVGTAYAADKIGSKDIKRGAVKSKHVADSGLQGVDVLDQSLTGADVNQSTLFNDNSLTGADINEGTLGEVPSATEAGGPFAFARITDSGAAADVVEAQSKGVSDAMVQDDPGGNGTVCIGVPFAFKGALATSEFGDVSLDFGDDNAICGLAFNDLGVYTRTPAGALADTGFFIVFYR